VEFSWGWKGKIFAEFFVLMLFMFYSIYYLIKYDHIKVDFDFIKIKEIVSFLFPLTFTIVGLYLMGTIDKVFIANIVSLEAAGIYAIALTMTIVINIIYDSALNAWQPYMYEYLDSNNYQDLAKVVKITYIFTLFVILSVFAYMWFSPYLFSFMIDEKFNDALEFLPILIVAYGFEGLRKPIVGFLYYVDRVKIAASVTFISAILNVVLNLILIKKYGVYGAAYATLISFFVQYILTLLVVKFYWKSIKSKKISLNKE
jgi:O-antigen/teichoic acid export membrane protein